MTDNICHITMFQMGNGDAWNDISPRLLLRKWILPAPYNNTEKTAALQSVTVSAQFGVATALSQRKNTLKSTRRLSKLLPRSLQFTNQSCKELISLSERGGKKSDIIERQRRAWQRAKRAGKLLLQGEAEEAMHQPKPEVKKKSEKIVKR